MADKTLTEAVIELLEADTTLMALIDRVHAAHVKLRIKPGTTKPRVITVAESDGSSHPVIPSKNGEVTVTIWYPGDRTTPRTSLEAVKQRVETLLDRQNVNLTDATNNLLVDIFYGGGGAPVFDEGSDSWMWPLTYNYVVERGTGNNA